MILATEAMQVFVTGDDKIRLSGNCTSKHMVIIGIVCYNAWHIDWRAHICQAPKFPHYV